MAAVEKSDSDGIDAYLLTEPPDFTAGEIARGLASHGIALSYPTDEGDEANFRALRQAQCVVIYVGETAYRYIKMITRTAQPVVIIADAESSEAAVEEVQRSFGPMRRNPAMSFSCTDIGAPATAASPSFVAKNAARR